MTSRRAATAMSLLRRLDDRGVRYCVLRNHEEIPVDPGRDIDLVAEAARVEDIESAIVAGGVEHGWQTVVRCRGHHEGTSYYFLDTRRLDGGRVHQLEIHFTRVRWAGATVLSTDELVASRVRNDHGIWAASSQVLAVQRILTYGLSGRFSSMRDRYWDELRAALADRDGVLPSLEEKLGDAGLADEIVAAVDSSDADRLSGLGGRMRRAFLSADPRARARELPDMVRYTAAKLTEDRRPARCGVLAVVPPSTNRGAIEDLTQSLEPMFLETMFLDGASGSLDDRGDQALRVVNRAGLVILSHADRSVVSRARWRSVACILEGHGADRDVRTIVDRFTGNHTPLVMEGADLA